MDKQNVRTEMSKNQCMNYFAIELLNIAGNENPDEKQIQEIERKLTNIVKNYS